MQEAIQYFNFYGTAVWNMLMVLNGSNWPTPMIPAFMDNRSFCLYFFLYIIICGWGLLNLVLGFVYLFFRVEQRDIAHRQAAKRAAYLSRAFSVMDEEGKGYLSYEQTDQLLDEIYRFYETSVKLPSKGALPRCKRSQCHHCIVDGSIIARSLFIMCLCICFILFFLCFALGNCLQRSGTSAYCSWTFRATT